MEITELTFDCTHNQAEGTGKGANGDGERILKQDLIMKRIEITTMVGLVKIRTPSPLTGIPALGLLPAKIFVARAI